MPDPTPEDLALGEAIVAAFATALAESTIKHGDQLLYGFMAGRITLVVEHNGLTILEREVDPHAELGTETETHKRLDPLPAAHPAWFTLLGYVVDVVQSWPVEARDEVMTKACAGLDCFRRAVADKLVTIAPAMRADGMYYEVQVRVHAETDEYKTVARVHSSNLPMRWDLLAADEWLANAKSLAEKPPDSPEGLEGA
jgi:hypothetical protein